MAVSDNYAPTKTLGNGVTVEFSANWNVIAASFIRVYLENVATGVQTLQTLDTDFELEFDSSGLTVDFTIGTTPPNTVYVIIAREIALTQGDPYKTSQGFQGRVIENSLDKITSITQDLQDELTRSLKYPLASGKSGTIPTPIDDTVLAFDGTTGALKTGPTTASIIAGSTAAAASAAAASSSASSASTSATNSSTSATLSQSWAVKTDGQVEATDYSAKAWAIGGTGTTTNNAKYYSEQAAASAAGVNLPSITATDTGSILQVNAAGDAYELLGAGTAGKFLMSNGADTALSFEDLPVVIELPIGTIIDYGGTTLQDNFLATDGAAVSRTTYAALFAAIGTTWGSGDGSTTFNVPNVARRTTVGSGGSGTGTLGNSVGDVGGAEMHALSSGENGPHAHVQTQNTTGSGSAYNLGGANPTGTPVNATNSTASSGSGSAHNNMQPSAVTFKQIRYQ